MSRKQLAPIDTRLDGAQSAQNSHLLNVAYYWYYVESLEFCIDCVQSAHQMLEKYLKRLR